MVEDHWVRVRVGVGGMNKSFQCSGPVPGQAAKASRKGRSCTKKKGTLSPSQRGRGQVYRSVVRCGRGSQESGIRIIKLAGQGQVMLLRAFWQETRSSAGSGLAGGGGLGLRSRDPEVQRSVC